MSTLLAALGFGLAAGVSPGPLLVLVLTATLRGGTRAGAKVAAVPLVSDAPVVAICLLMLGRLPSSWLAWLGMVGGVAVIAVGVQTIREGRGADLDALTDGPPRSGLGQAVVVNLLSPHPWISWLTFLGPLAVTAWRTSPALGVAFVLAFYATLVGAKVAVAALVGRGRERLTTNGYRRVVVTAGASLLVLGAVMLVEYTRQVA